MTGASTGDLALAAVGAVIALAALADLFVTVFNYDGFSFLANRLHGIYWKALRTLTRPLPDVARHNVLSLGSASMLPATYMLWLGLLICGLRSSSTQVSARTDSLPAPAMGSEPPSIWAQATSAA
jgi:hypothetical protein